jgi:hypothetical protein
MQGVEKIIISQLLVEGSNRRIYNVDRHAGMVSAVAHFARMGIVLWW